MVMNLEYQQKVKTILICMLGNSVFVAQGISLFLRHLVSKKKDDLSRAVCGREGNPKELYEFGFQEVVVLRAL